MPYFIFIQQISVLNILYMLYNLHFFSSKCRLFHNATLLGFCITHILNTGCAKIWKKKKKSVAKRLKESFSITVQLHVSKPFLVFVGTVGLSHNCSIVQVSASLWKERIKRLI